MEILDFAFEYTALTSIVIPASVKKIYESLRSCRALTSITFLGTTPPKADSYSFEDTNDAPIYVPAESVESYKVAPGFSTFADRIQAIPE